MRKKETPNPSRVRGRGVEVSETLFYTPSMTSRSFIPTVLIISYRIMLFNYYNLFSHLLSMYKSTAVLFIFSIIFFFAFSGVYIFITHSSISSISFIFRYFSSIIATSYIYIICTKLYSKHRLNRTLTVTRFL